MGTASATPGPDSAALTQQAWAALIASRSNLGLPDLTVLSLTDFLQSADDPQKNPNILTAPEQALILDQAEALLGNIYPHLPFKPADFPKADPPVDPLGDIQKLRARMQASGGALAELDFHCATLKIFASVRDPHTTYTLPAFYQGAVAFLPFRLGFYIDETGKARYHITAVMQGFVHPTFMPGSELLPSPGGPDLAVLLIQAAALTPGANAAGQQLRGLARLTVVPVATAGTNLWAGDWTGSDAKFNYLTPLIAQPQSITFPWGVARATGLSQTVPPQAFSLSPDLCASQTASNLLWNPQARWPQAPQGVISSALGVLKSVEAAVLPPPQAPAAAAANVSVFPDVFAFQTTSGISPGSGIDPAHITAPSSPAKKFGYIAIQIFNTSIPFGLTDALLNEFRRILTLLQPEAPDGLIVDIRGNPGGDIAAAEGMLQMLAPATVTPVNFHLANTPAALKVLNAIAAMSNPPSLPSPLTAWLNDRNGIPLPAGPPLTSGQPLTTDLGLPGQAYQGPVVLMVDALTYSAADMFAAGFADNRIGKIIGPDATTGGGGASMWTHDQLSQFLSALPGAAISLQALPHGADMSLAFLRCSRIGPSAGVPIEDRGVQPDIVCPRTLQDMLAAAGLPVQSHLLASACDTLAGMPVHRIENAAFQQVADATQISLTPTGLDSLTFTSSDSSVPPVTVSAAAAVNPVKVPFGSSGPPLRILVQGFSNGAPAAATMLTITVPAKPHQNLH
jgi:hypothetical protein